MTFVDSLLHIPKPNLAATCLEQTLGDHILYIPDVDMKKFSGVRWCGQNVQFHHDLDFIKVVDFEKTVRRKDELKESGAELF